MGEDLRRLCVRLFSIRSAVGAPSTLQTSGGIRAFLICGRDRIPLIALWATSLVYVLLPAFGCAHGNLLNRSLSDSGIRGRSGQCPQFVISSFATTLKYLSGQGNSESDSTRKPAFFSRRRLGFSNSGDSDSRVSRIAVSRKLIGLHGPSIVPDLA